MKLTLLLAPLFLAGCMTVPVTAKFPEAPKELQVSCVPLEQTPLDVKLSDLTKIIVNNYSAYYSCSSVVDSWKDWYVNQKRIYEELK